MSAEPTIPRALAHAVIDAAARPQAAPSVLRYRALHLAAHCAESGDLGELLGRAANLVAVEPDQLVRHLHRPSALSQPLTRAYLEVCGALDGQRPQARLAAILRAAPRDAAIALDGIAPAWTVVADTVTRTPPPATYTGHTSWVWKVAIGAGPAGRLLASASSDGTVHVRDVESGLVRAVCIGHEGPVSAVAFGRVADRRALASAGFDGTVRLWDPADGAPLACLTGHSSGVWNVSFGEIAGRSILVSAASDNTVRLWDPQLGGCLSVLAGHTDWVWDVTTAVIDGRLVVASGSDDATIRVWDALAGDSVAVLRGHAAGVMGVRFTSLAGQPVLVSAGQDTTLRIWETRGWTQQDSRVVHGEWIRCLDVLATGDRTLAATCGDDFTVRIWDLGAGHQLAEFRGHRNIVSGVALARDEPGLAARPSGVTVWSGGFDRAICAWDVPDRRPAPDTPEPRVTTVAITRVNGATLLAAAVADRLTVRVQPEVGSRISETALGNAITAIAMTPVDGRALVAVADGLARIQVRPAAQATVLSSWEAHSDTISALAAGCGRRGPLLASASYDRTVRLWRMPGGAELATLTGHQDWVNAVALGQVGGRAVAASGGFDATVRIWDVETGDCLRVLEGHGSAVSGVALGQVGGRAVAASGGFDATVRIWDVETGDCLRVLEGHGSAVSGVALGQVGGRAVAASGGFDATVRIWDIETGHPCATAAALPPRSVVVPALAPVECTAMCEKTVLIGTERGLLAVELGGWADLFGELPSPSPDGEVLRVV